MMRFLRAFKLGQRPRVSSSFHEAFGGGTVAGSSTMASSNPTKEDS